MVDEVIGVRRVVFLLACVLGCTAASGVTAQQPRGVTAAETVDTSIVPAEARTTWTPGVPGGVPIRTAVCRTVAAASYGDGLQDASAAIQAAVNACPAGQVVSLSAGTFTVNNLVQVSKGITVRGAGAGATVLRKTNGAVPFSYIARDTQPIFVVGPNRWPKTADSTSVNLIADAVSGAKSVSVKNAGGFTAGQFVLLDEDHYNTGGWVSLPNRKGVPTNARIWASDRVVYTRHNPPDPADDPFPDSLTWFARPGRPINEIKEIAAVNGNVITFTTPLHIGYRVLKMAQVTRYDSVHVRNAGIEDLTVTGGADGNIRFEAAAYSWMKSVENTLWLGEGVSVDQSFGVEVRDSYIHDAAWPVPGGGGYAISLAGGSSAVLVENNIVVKANKMMVARASGAGSVVGYNYMDNGYIWNTEEWVEVGLSGSHYVGGHHMLFEGNESFNYDSDNTHGSAIAMTVFRNHLTGRRRDIPGKSNVRAAGLMFGSWWHAFIGNVMGDEGQMSGWLYEDSGVGSPSGSAWGDGQYIWKLGYDPTHWEQSVDPKVRTTTLRDGNFDYVTNSVKWDRTPRAIPASLYLTSKPAFFGDNLWPWVDPTSPTPLAVLPARQRYERALGTASAAPGLRSVR